LLWAKGLKFGGATAKPVIRKSLGRLSQVDPVALTVEYLSHEPKVAFDFLGEPQSLTRKPFELNLELGDDDRYDPLPARLSSFQTCRPAPPMLRH
jgi:hypothetical protein